MGIPNFREIFRKSRSRELEIKLGREAAIKLGIFIAASISMALLRDGVGPHWRSLVTFMRGFTGWTLAPPGS